MSEIKVLIIEDEPIVAANIRMALDHINFKVAGVAYNKMQALELLAKNYPDTALIDINLDGAQEGIEIARLINEKYQIPFLFLTAHADRLTLANAKLTEPAGYIVKPFTEAELLASLEIALYNFAQRQKHHFPTPDWPKLNESLDGALSSRELEVLQLIFEGKTNVQMAEQLHLSINTIKTHLLSLYGKLEAGSRTEALARARQLM